MSAFLAKLGLAHRHLWAEDSGYRIAIFLGPVPLVGALVFGAVWLAAGAAGFASMPRTGAGPPWAKPIAGAASNSAQSDGVFLTGCPFSKGDSVSRVKEFYGIASDPVKLERPWPSSTYYDYHFPQYGVWVFFNEHLLINGLRFDAPFTGKIGGVAIGDDKATVRLVRREPGRQITGFAGPDTAWTYNGPYENASFLRYDFVASSGKVQSILANSCHIDN